MPPAAPLDLKAERGNASAQVRWTDPAPSGADGITGHELELASEPDYQEWTPAILASAVSCQAGNPAPCKAEIGGLGNGTKYKVRVRALNAAGAGAWVVLHNWVTPEVLEQLPGVPPNLVGSAGPGRLTGVWTPVTAAGQGASAIVRYRLVALAEGRLAGHCDTQGQPAPTTCTIAGLASGVPYTLQVRAFNDQRKFSGFSPPAGPYTPN
jgi:titin